MSRVLDGGAQGVIVPDVNTRGQAGAIVNACRFPPLGKRSVMGLGPALGYRAVPLAELNPKLNAETAVIVMLETAEGVENCEAIAAVDGVDVLLIGSGDLTTDLGIPGQIDHPRLRSRWATRGGGLPSSWNGVSVQRRCPIRAYLQPFR